MSRGRIRVPINTLRIRPEQIKANKDSAILIFQSPRFVKILWDFGSVVQTKHPLRGALRTERPN